MRLDVTTDQRFFVIKVQFAAWWLLVALLLMAHSYGAWAILVAPLVAPLGGGLVLLQGWTIWPLGLATLGGTGFLAVCLYSFLRRPSKSMALLLHAAVFAYWLSAVLLIFGMGA